MSITYWGNPSDARKRFMSIFLIWYRRTQSYLSLWSSDRAMSSNLLKHVSMVFTSSYYNCVFGNILHVIIIIHIIHKIFVSYDLVVVIIRLLLLVSTMQIRVGTTTDLSKCYEVTTLFHKNKPLLYPFSIVWLAEIYWLRWPSVLPVHHLSLELDVLASSSRACC